MWSRLLYRRVKLNRLRLSEQSPAACCSKLALFLPDKDDWLWSGSQELLMGCLFWLSPFWSLCWRYVQFQEKQKISYCWAVENLHPWTAVLVWNSLWDLALSFCLVHLHWFKTSCESEVLLFIDIANPSISSGEMLRFCHLRKMSSGSMVVSSRSLWENRVDSGFLNSCVFAHCWHLVQVQHLSFLLLRFHIWRSWVISCLLSWSSWSPLLLFDTVVNWFLIDCYFGKWEKCRTTA